MMMRRRVNVNDLIIVYLISKIKKGLNPVVSEEELLNFLTYFNTKKTIIDLQFDYLEIIDKFYRKKNKKWGQNPHIILDDKNNLRATYDLNTNDVKNTEIYVLSDKEIEEIKTIIDTYIKNMPMRILSSKKGISSEIKKTSLEFSALMCQTIWNNYIAIYTRKSAWPVQCKSMHKYLFETDLAKIINLPSIRFELLAFYEIFAQRLSVLLANENEVVLSNDSNYFLAYANYSLCVDGFDNLMKYVNDKEIKMEIKNKKEDEIYTSNAIINNIVSNSELKKLVKKLNNQKDR